MEVDARVIPVETLDASRMVLVDGSSLNALANVLTHDVVPVHLAPVHFGEPGGRSLANIIQNVVLYETLIFDSILLDIRSSEADTACELFPGVFKGVYLRPGFGSNLGIREIISNRLSDVASVCLDDVSGLPNSVKTDWNQLDSSEKPMFDTIEETTARKIPLEYAHDIELQQLNKLSPPLRTEVPLCCLNSANTLARAHFYLELAHILGIPFSPDPVRAVYFSRLLKSAGTALRERKPEKIIAFFMKRFFDEAHDNPNGLITLDLEIPPIADYVLAYAKTQRCSLRTATIEVRESAHARKFREWCGRFVATGDGSIAGAAAQREMLKHLEAACDAWRNDLGNLVSYKPRKLGLDWLPPLGGVLKALGLGDVSIQFNDPVLWPEKRFSYFVFLNDLLVQK